MKLLFDAQQELGLSMTGGVSGLIGLFGACDVQVVVLLPSYEDDVG